MSSSNQNDGGPAFPLTRADFKDMSLRDWFAGMALQGMLASTFMKGDIDEYKPDSRANHAYQLADAMIAERNK